MYTQIKTPEEIENMRKAGDICSRVLKMLKDSVGPGKTTKQLADMASEMIRDNGGEPSFLGYKDFPDVICISLNEEVVHGIPDAKRVIHSGDIITFDLGVTYKGMIVDSAVSVLVDSNDKTRKMLLRVTEESLAAGIRQLKDGCFTGDIGAAVEKVLKKNSLGVIRDLVGHGVGHQVHEEPNIPNYGKEGTGPRLRSGMTIAIEPMASLGTEDIYITSDGWTIKTGDDSLSAHFEQTVLLTPDGYEILTPFM
ncbi:MAG TPA: type I methionyl aminopeptidase [Candidatus Saccharimonadales bacterium]|nr:type I methionyl aminopeptidase [Candidatus Saccharimonadales bacterium]